MSIYLPGSNSCWGTSSFCYKWRWVDRHLGWFSCHLFWLHCFCFSEVSRDELYSPCQIGIKKRTLTSASGSFYSRRQIHLAAQVLIRVLVVPLPPTTYINTYIDFFLFFLVLLQGSVSSGLIPETTCLSFFIVEEKQCEGTIIP